MGCTPHGLTTPYSKKDSALALKEASRQASIAKTPQQALSYYETVYNKNRGDQMVAYSYAKALRGAGFYDRAVRVLDSHYMARDVSQETIFEYIKNHIAAARFQEAQTLLQKRIDIETSQLKKQIMQQYLQDVKQARLERTIEPDRPDFSQIVVHPEYHHLLGVVYDAQGRFSEAERQFRKALSVNIANEAVVKNNLALSLAHQGQIKEAMQLVSQAFILNPERPEIAQNLELITRLYQEKT